MRRLTYIEGFRSTVRRYPDAVAVVTVDGEPVTYRELDERSDRLAAALDARLGDGRCAGLAQNRVEMIVLMLASMKRGRASVQLPTRGAVGELESNWNGASASGLLYDAAKAEDAAALLERVEYDAAIGFGGAADAVFDAESYGSLLEGTDPADAPAEPATDPGEYAIHFTSGTTGQPKGVLSNQEQAWLAANQPALEMSLTAGDRALVCTPWYHGVTCFTWILAHMLVGATLVLQAEFEPAESLRLMADHDVTGLLAVPTQLEVLLDAQDGVEADLSALAYIRTGGAVVPDTLIDAVRERFTGGVFNTYGQTEAVVNLSFAYPEEQDDHPGTIGKGTYSWEVRVVEAADPPEKPDPDALVEPGGTGEIIARGPLMIDGYVDNPEETATLFVEDDDGSRWLRTEDVAVVDEDRYMVVVDRVDNMIVSGGENIYPEEVQQVLKEHPGVRDAGVVGVPDETWGQMVVAAVDAEEGVTEEELDRFCRDHDMLPDFKRPRRYLFVDEIPRSATGTLLRGDVEEMFDEA